MRCYHCEQEMPVGGWSEGNRVRHERACTQNPDNMADQEYRFACGHTGMRKPFGNDPDGSKIAAFLQERECTDCFLAQYRAAQAARTPEQIAEHAYELRAAFGAGETVVNVITGERSTT
jgi:hypothetical protein